MRFILTVGSLLLLPILLTAQDVRHDYRIEFAQGCHNVDKSIKENAETIDKLLSTLRNAQNRPDEKLLGIGFSGSVSPEGSVALNLRLSKSRLASTERYIRDRFQIPDSIITRRDLFIDWKILDSLVRTNERLGRKDSILEVLRSGQSDESKIETLKDLDSGSAWNEMQERLFPKMRCSGITIVITSRIGTLQRVRSLETDLSDGDAALMGVMGLTPPYAVLTNYKSTRNNILIGLKTNLLKDAALIPDAGIEIAIGQDWSASAGWNYAWWSKNGTHKYWRYYGGDAGFRWWFGGKHSEKGKLSGHHIGLNGSLFTFDFEAGDKGYMGGTPGGKLADRACWSAGAEYGYSVPVARHLNIDFSLAVGYAGGKYWKYEPDDCYVALSESPLRYFGPTKAEISLVWVLGDRKGGKR